MSSLFFVRRLDWFKRRKESGRLAGEGFRREEAEVGAFAIGLEHGQAEGI